MRSTDVGHLTGRRVLVVGASSGIGRSVGLAAAAAGASVALAARRFDELRAVAAEAGPASLALECDVRSPAAVETMVDEAVAFLGGLDSVVYATGVNHLALLADTDADEWRRLFETNVVGAALVTGAALPHLAAGRSPRIAYLSSHSVPRPWPGLGAYAATKAALETTILAWRAEVPGVVFARVNVGPTLTGMADRWDPGAAAEFFTRWAAAGLLDEHEPQPAEVRARGLVAWLGDPAPADELDLC